VAQITAKNAPERVAVEVGGIAGIEQRPKLGGRGGGRCGYRRLRLGERRDSNRKAGSKQQQGAKMHDRSTHEIVCCRYETLGRDAMVLRGIMAALTGFRCRVSVVNIAWR
jgi:hypothetical protein